MWAGRRTIARGGGSGGALPGGRRACWNSWNCWELVCTLRRILIATSWPQYTPLYRSPKAPDAILSWKVISAGSSSQSSSDATPASVLGRACARQQLAPASKVDLSPWVWHLRAVRRATCGRHSVQPARRRLRPASPPRLGACWLTGRQQAARAAGQAHQVCLGGREAASVGGIPAQGGLRAGGARAQAAAGLIQGWRQLLEPGAQCLLQLARLPTGARVSACISTPGCGEPARLSPAALPAAQLAREAWQR